MELKPNTPGGYCYVIDYGSALELDTGAPIPLYAAAANLEDEGFNTSLLCTASCYMLHK